MQHLLLKRTFYILTVSILSFSCSPKVNSALVQKYAPLPFDEEVVVLEIDASRPKNVETLGIVEIRDTGFSTKCNYEMVLEKAKLEARKVGGNILHLTKHQKPNFWSTCHRIDAIILKSKGKTR